MTFCDTNTVRKQAPLPLMALFGRAAAVFRRPLLGVDQT